MAQIHRVPEIVSLGEVLSYLGYGTTGTDAIVGQLQSLKRKAEAAVRKFMGCGVRRATYTHYLPRGNPFDLRNSAKLLSQDGWSQRRTYLGPDIVLPQYPVRSITSIHEEENGNFGQTSGAFGSDALLTEGTDYTWPIDAEGFSKVGMVYRLDQQWLAEPGSIKVVYVAGWTKHELHGDTDEEIKDASPIQQAVLRTIREYWSDKQQAEAGADGAPGPIKAESLADYSVQYDTSAGGVGIHLPDEVKDELRGYKRLPNIRATT